jgi:hypothetical protein
LDSSFFSSEENQIADNILPNQNIHDFDPWIYGFI